MTDGPLAGRRIVVTRSRRQAGTLSAALQELGAEVIELPTIEIVAPESYQPLDQALGSLGRYQWLIVTSANTVRVIAERLGVLGLDPGVLRGVKIAAIGPATAEALADLGVSADVVPTQYVAESVVNALRGQVSGTRVLLARATIARDIIPQELGQAGAVVDVVDAYRTVVPGGSVDAVRSMFLEGDLGGRKPIPGDNLPDAVTFTSSSTVKHFFSLLRDAGLELPADIRAISIGPITSATLREHGREPSAEALKHDVRGLAEAVVLVFSPAQDFQEQS